MLPPKPVTGHFWPAGLNPKGDENMEELMMPPTDVPPELLDKLSRTLDLVLKTAAAASADNNHPVVIQSAREVTRIAALMHKITSSANKPGRAPRADKAGGKPAEPSTPGKQAAARPEPSGRDITGAGRTGTDDIQPDDFLLPDLETVYTPLEMSYWQGLPDNIFQKFSDDIREMQTIGKEMADELRAADQGSGAAD
jgi:hypothetical protein